ncbi:hypothetical protein ISN44_As08g031450, partial [Arabidopsis suecica]
MSDKKRPMTASDYIKNQPSMQGKNLNSKSAEITHYPNKSEPTQIAYSTCKILRIQSPHDLGFLNLHTTKPFSQPGYHIQGYTYTDYQNAFFRALCLRAFDHSWFLSLDSKCPNQVPGWFHEWWYWFGPTNEIYPTDIIKTNFPFYSKHLPKQDIDSFKQIAFHIDMGIPWICSWHYNLTLLLPGMPYSLVREYRIKWWDKYDLNRCSLTNIAKLFQITSQTKAQVKAVSKSIPLLTPQDLIQRYGTDPNATSATQLIQKYGVDPKASSSQAQQTQQSSSPAHSTTSSKSSKKEELQKMFDAFLQQIEESNIDTTIQDDDPYGGP